MFHIFAQNKSFTTENSVSDFVIYYRHSVFEIKNQELPATLQRKRRRNIIIRNAGLLYLQM